MERTRPYRLVILTLAVVGILSAGWWLGTRKSTLEVSVPGNEGPRATVEVLNGTDIDGMARRVTRGLRNRGIDVVYFGSARPENRDTTQLYIRRGDGTEARRVQNILGFGKIVAEPDSQLFLDVTVLLGRDAISFAAAVLN